MEENEKSSEKLVYCKMYMVHTGKYDRLSNPGKRLGKAHEKFVARCKTVRIHAIISADKERGRVINWSSLLRRSKVKSLIRKPAFPGKR